MPSWSFPAEAADGHYYQLLKGCSVKFDDVAQCIIIYVEYESDFEIKKIKWYNGLVEERCNSSALAKE